MREPLVFAATSDFGGRVRGKSFPLSALPSRLEKGVGWTPTNVMITCFDGIVDGPFGSLGDLVLIPDPKAEMKLDLGDRVEHVMLGDIRDLDGNSWDLCTRSILKAAVARLARVGGGLQVLSAFEHEFQMISESNHGGGFSLGAFSARRPFGEKVMYALRAAGMDSDTFMHEYGRDQFEVTIGPKDALRAADEAVLLREITRLVAQAEGEIATFTPICDPEGVGNGVHIHISLRDADGRPVTHDANGPGGLSPVASAFTAGILKYVPEFLALTAPSVISYTRLTPHRWSAAYNNLGFRDREATVRICPVSGRTPEAIARQYNFEYRAADATACPYLALAVLLHAGAQGIEEDLTAPEPTAEDLSLLSSAALEARGLERLPESLDAALGRFEAGEVVAGWFPPQFAGVYLAHKRGEAKVLAGQSLSAQCRVYEGVY